MYAVAIAAHFQPKEMAPEKQSLEKFSAFCVWGVGRALNGEVLESQYREAKKKIPQGIRPSFPVPNELFTYLSHPGMPRTNQALENCNRFFKLRLKTIGTFHSWKTATWYCNALVAHRRFLPFTDRKNHQPNGKSPLELAGCTTSGIDYLTGEKSNREVGC